MDGIACRAEQEEEEVEVSCGSVGRRCLLPLVARTRKVLSVPMVEPLFKTVLSNGLPPGFWAILTGVGTETCMS